MAKLNGESKSKKKGKKNKGPGVIKNRSKDTKCYIMFNPEYDDGKNQKEVYISDIGDYVKVGEPVYLPESSVKWLRRQGRWQEKLQKVGNRIKRTGEYELIPRFKVMD